MQKEKPQTGLKRESYKKEGQKCRCLNGNERLFGRWDVSQRNKSTTWCIQLHVATSHGVFFIVRNGELGKK